MNWILSNMNVFSISLMSGMGFLYVDWWRKKVDQDIQMNIQTQNFSNSLYEYEIRSKSQTQKVIGVDLVKYFQNKIQDNSNNTESAES